MSENPSGARRELPGKMLLNQMSSVIRGSRWLAEVLTGSSRLWLHDWSWRKVLLLIHPSFFKWIPSSLRNDFWMNLHWVISMNLAPSTYQEGWEEEFAIIRGHDRMDWGNCDILAGRWWNTMWFESWLNPGFTLQSFIYVIFMNCLDFPNSQFS
jgi:hypothetical protein